MSGDSGPPLSTGPKHSLPTRAGSHYHGSAWSIASAWIHFMHRPHQWLTLEIQYTGEWSSASCLAKWKSRSRRMASHMASLTTHRTSSPKCTSEAREIEFLKTLDKFQQRTLCLDGRVLVHPWDPWRDPWHHMAPMGLWGFSVLPACCLQHGIVWWIYSGIGIAPGL